MYHLVEVVIIDPRQSGVSGDMLLSAFTDLFDCHDLTNNILDKVTNIAESLFETKSKYSVLKTTKNGIFGTTLQFSIENDFPSLNVQEFNENWMKEAMKLLRELVWK